MNKSFKDRLAALEALEAEQEQRSIYTSSDLTEAEAVALSDDDVLDEAIEGMAIGWLRLNPFASDAEERNTLRPCGIPPYCPNDQYWRIIGERADVLRKAQGRLFIPATAEQIQEIDRLLEAGDLVVQVFNPQIDLRRASTGEQICTCCWVRSTAGLAHDDPLWSALYTLKRVLDGLRIQAGLPFCQSSEEARAVLGDVLVGIS